MLAVPAVLLQRPAMERSIKRTVEQAIAAAGYQGVAVDVDGVEVELSGSVADEAERAAVLRIAGRPTTRGCSPSGPA